jgi:nucleotide-binding universal stress UspA family protein
MILIGYDGSADARAAIQHAGDLMPGAETTVTTIWDPTTKIPAVLGPVTGRDDISDDNRAAAQDAQRRAREGAQLANEAGLRATPDTVSRDTSIADAIMDHADRLDVSAIVVGSRGLTAIGSLLLGSVSHAIVQQADRPVVIVTSPDVAAHRHQQRDARAPA